MPKILVGNLNESFYICISYIDAILLCDLCHQTAPYPIQCKGTFRLGCSIVASYSDTPIGRFGYSCGLIAGRIFAQRSAPTNGFVDADFLNSSFLGGLGEDIGLDIKPLQRFLASLVSAALAVVLFGYWVPYVDFPGLRLITSMGLISITITITIIVSGGICHAVNLIDGLNGLSICWAICAAITMAMIALNVNDIAVFRLLILLIGTLVGILCWNFPLGKLFLGDAGAYTFGHALAWIALLLMNRHPEISPLALLLIFLWPITDMLPSMMRRKRSGKPIGQPDPITFSPDGYAIVGGSVFHPL